MVADAAAAGETGHVSRPGAVAYLVTRNNMRYRRRFAGAAGVLDGLRMYGRHTVHYVRLVLDPRSPRALRRFNFARATGTWAGVGGFLLKREGRPPAWLPGVGEMGRPAAPPSGGAAQPE